MTLGRSDAQALIKAALKAATLKDVSVRVTSSRGANLRFAENAPTTSGQADRVEVSVTATREQASATVTGTAQDAAGVAALVARAEALAALAPRDPEHMPPLAAQRYAKVAGEDPATVKLGPDARTDAVARVLKVARAGKLVASGLYEHVHRSVALGTSAGLLAFSFAVWFALRTVIVFPVIRIAHWVLTAWMPELFQAAAQSYQQVKLSLYASTHAIGGLPDSQFIVDISFDALKFCYGLPIYVGLTAATALWSDRYWPKILLGLVILPVTQGGASLTQAVSAGILSNLIILGIVLALAMIIRRLRS